MIAWAPGTGAVGTGAHPFNLDINGIDRIASVDRTSLVVTSPGPGENGSMTFELLDPDSTIDIIEWDHVTLDEWAAPRPRQFGGFVQFVDTTVWAAGGRTHRVRVTGYGILLDKRFIVSESQDEFDFEGTYIGALMLHLVNLYGGVITATGYTGDSTNHDDVATVSQTVLVTDDWRPNAGIEPVAMRTLRSAIEQWGALGFDHRGSATPVPFIYWIDPYARFHATWIPADGPADSYEGFAAPVTDSTNSPMGDLRFAADGSDLLTSVYAVSSDVTLDPSQWVRRAPLPVAGHLEDTISVAVGGSGQVTQGAEFELETREGSTIAASFDRQTSSPLDYRPGMGLTWTNAQLGLVTQDIRITGVGIRYLSGSQRRYSLTLGGRLTPSLARETGKYAWRPR